MYRVVVPRRVERLLSALPADHHPEVMKGLLELTSDPRPPASRKLVGYEHTWCAYLPLRYRAYYDIDDSRQTILVLAIVQSRSTRERLAALVDD
jgi:mRNA-degrading endonuclease RelE of RelBE toxin-antitoxin system